jgi:hypothetical protein
MDFEKDSHIHRLLELRVNDQLLPFMGYFGAGDVCYGYDNIKFIYFQSDLLLRGAVN